MQRVYSVSWVNWLILLFYVVNLFRLSLNFRTFYAQFALGTTALTNVLLFGLSDSLAQTLRSAAKYKADMLTLRAEDTPQSALFQYVLSRGRPKQIWLDEEGDDLAELGLVPTRTEEPQDLHSDEEESLRTDFDFRRLALFSLWGFMMSFVQSPWYGFLRSAYSRDAKLVIVVQRVLADQLVYSPLMLALFLFYLAVVVERRPHSVAGQSPFWTNYVQILGVNMCVWPTAQFTNFLIIPSAAQIPFSSSLSVLWNTYLSLNTK